MKKSLVFFCFMVLLMGGVVGFFYFKNTHRETVAIDIIFTHSPRFLEMSSVNKLLTQNRVSSKALLKDSLDLNMLENQLKKVPEVRNIEMYLLPKGVLSVEVTERNPLFKVGYNTPHYADEQGVQFGFKPLEGTAYPVFISNSNSISLKETARLIEALQSDSFVKSELKEVVYEEQIYSIRLKSYPFSIVLGAASAIPQKIEKLKVFCAFQRLQDSLTGYNKINLSFKDQVVATTF